MAFTSIRLLKVQKFTPIPVIRRAWYMLGAKEHKRKDDKDV